MCVVIEQYSSPCHIGKRDEGVLGIAAQISAGEQVHQRLDIKRNAKIVLRGRQNGWNVVSHRRVAS